MMIILTGTSGNIKKYRKYLFERTSGPQDLLLIKVKDESLNN